MKYLLIDDNPIDLLVNEKIIQSFGSEAEIIKVQSAQEALEYLKGHEGHEPDIILLDIKMPLMDGYGFLQEFAKMPSSVNEKVRIYMVSSSIDPQDIKRSQENPMVKGFLEKPLRRDTFQKVL